MKRCLQCDAHYASSSANCSRCGAGPTIVDGFCCYAGELAHGGGGFKVEAFSHLADSEASSFWFQSRNKLIIWAMRKYIGDLRSFLEVGCGTGFVLSAVAKAFPEAALQGSEIFTAGLGIASRRLPAVTFLQMDARKIPFVNEFDAVGAFDVIEHIEEDEEVLSQIHAALKPGGIMFLTVPQHAWLWSAVDENSCHVRRYSARQLHEAVRKAGFQIVRSTSFVFGPLPAMMASRMLQSRTGRRENAGGELKIGFWLNAALSFMLAAEILLIRLGIDFPVGGSRLLVARKMAH